MAARNMKEDEESFGGMLVGPPSASVDALEFEFILKAALSSSQISSMVRWDSRRMVLRVLDDGSGLLGRKGTLPTCTRLPVPSPYLNSILC
jgi:hypothetical protein